LGKGGGSHVVKDILSTSTEASGAVWHESLSLSGADLAAQVGLSTLLVSTSQKCNDLAKLAFSTFRSVKGNDMVADFDVGNTIANRLDDSTTLMSTNNRKSTLRILPRERICISMTHLAINVVENGIAANTEDIPQSRES
jgi:hypothetical protein